MTNKLIKTGVVCLLSSCAFISAAQAGGFGRGDADTDILFEDGTVAIRGGTVFVAPRRTFATINGASATDDAYSNNFWIPSVAAKLTISERLACAFTFANTYGADVDYGLMAQSAYSTGPNGPNYPTHKDFVSNEYGATCDVKFDAGKGNLHLLGGAFIQDFSYTAVSAGGTLKLDDDAAFGYRFGMAYDIPEYALRAQLMYRSQVDHETNSGSFDVGSLGTTVLPASGYGSLPQSVKLSLQSGVAPGWLVYGSVKWSDWSVLDSLHYSSVAFGNKEDVYNWKDGWTVQAGVGHAFTDTLSGTVNLTYDSGVGSGADIMTDSWTVGVGTIVKLDRGELRLGGAVSYLTAGSQSVVKDASFDATADGDWSYALGASFKMAF